MSFLDFFRPREKVQDAAAPAIVEDAKPAPPPPNPFVMNDAGLQSFAAGLGTDRDKMALTDYVRQAPLTRTEIEAMYGASALTRRVIDVVPEDMVREWRRVSFDDPKKENLIAVEREEVRLDLRAKMEEAQRWARLYGGAMILVSTGEQDLSSPLNVDLIGKGGIKSLHVFDRWRCSGAGVRTTDLDSPNFGMFEHYMIGSTEANQLSGARVHWTRLLRFDGVRTPYFMFSANGFWHASELDSIKEKIKHADAAAACIATMLFEANVDVLKVHNLASQLSTDKGTASVVKRFLNAATIKSFNRMFVLDDKETYEKKSNTFTGLPDLLDRFHTLVSAVSGIPVTRLFGESPGGLNSTGEADISGYYDTVKNAQTKNFDPVLRRFDPMLARSALGSFPDDWSSEWAPLWQESESEKATTQKTRADRDKIYIDLGVVPPQAVARDLKEDGTYRNMTDEDIAEIEAQSERDAEFEEKQLAALAAGAAAKPEPGEKGAAAASGGATAKKNEEIDQ